MNLRELNQLTPSPLKQTLGNCCGATAWIEGMVAAFPFTTKKELFQKAEEVWNSLPEKDWMEAFEHHPKIGDLSSLQKKFASTAQWAAGEQAAVHQTSEEVLQSLAEGNAKYEATFGYIFIVCATGKSAEEMLRLLQSRLPNDPKDEIKIAAAEQAKITKIRLEKLFQ